ncbi:MAG: lipoyl(octanoyl) transferase LipB [Candidatus Omnitrophica bacterium]|nr:lipoyl(octanoyl) transferase LipB [Candidatus Omnitrophota bacterium]
MDVRDLGRITYEDALEVQLALVEKRVQGYIPDTLALAEHFPVLTLGRLAEERSIIDRVYFEERRVPVVCSNRGGKATYHSPGQLVLYPVVDLGEKKKDVAFYIDFLERTVARSLRRLGVPAERDGSRRGVWSGGRKIAFIGIALKRWVAFHGVSININNDLEAFSRILPCGESGIKVISVRQVLGHSVDMTRTKEIFTRQFVSDLQSEYSCETRSIEYHAIRGEVKKSGGGNHGVEAAGTFRKE